MIVAAHQTMMAPQGAPLPYDAEVEYVESTGMQYVDTGVVGATPCRIQIRFAITSPGAYTTLFGINQSSVRLTGPTNSAGAKLGIGYGSYVGYQYTFSTGVFADGDWVFDPAATSFSINGTALSTNTFADGIDHSPYTIPLFCYRSYSNPSLYRISARIASCTIRQGSGLPLVRDYIPVRIGTTGYLYDRANPTGGPNGNGLYGNAGTGSFTLGPDKT